MLTSAIEQSSIKRERLMTPIDKFTSNVAQSMAVVITLQPAGKKLIEIIRD